MDICLNLSELLIPDYLENYSLDDLIYISDLPEKPKRIYLGSSFCSQYFLHLTPLFSSSKIISSGLPITLTIPIFTQRNLKQAKNALQSILKENPCIDEVTVNDVGMLEYVRLNTDKKINLGRLFFKDPRDIRVSEYNSGMSKFSLFDHLSFYGDITGVELDQITETIELNENPNLIVAVHSPYAFMSTGNICKFASINKPVEKKFRPNAPCGLECAKIHEFLTEDFNHTGEFDQLFRLGRTFYFLQRTDHLKDYPIDRKIIFPLKKLTLLEEK